MSDIWHIFCPKEMENLMFMSLVNTPLCSSKVDAVVFWFAEV